MGWQGKHEAGYPFQEENALFKHNKSVCGSAAAGAVRIFLLLSSSPACDHNLPLSHSISVFSLLSLTFLFPLSLPLFLSIYPSFAFLLNPLTL